MLFSRKDIPILFKEFIIRIITLDYLVFKKIINKEIKAKKNIDVLDVGCGTGIISPLFSQSNYIGIDIDRRLIDFAKRKYRYSFQVMSSEEISFPKNSFDLVLVVGVIHHLSDKGSNRTLAEMKKVLKSNGKILMIEAIPPMDSHNYLGRLIRSLDEGHNIRKLEEYSSMFKKYFRVNKEYKNRGGIVDYGVFVLIK